MPAPGEGLRRGASTVCRTVGVTSAVLGLTLATALCGWLGRMMGLMVVGINFDFLVWSPVSGLEVEALLLLGLSGDRCMSSGC